MNTKKKLLFALAYLAIGITRLIMAIFDSRETSISSYTIAGAFTFTGLVGIIFALANKRKKEIHKIE